MKARTGMSSYLGDNNTLPFNPAAFEVAGKRPYSFGLEAGYQINERWSAAMGVQFADYPIITRFYDDLDVESHPTTRRTYQALVRHTFNTNRLAPYMHFGYHLTFGNVNIFEVSKLANGETLNTQSHYIHGPILGFGIDYAISPSVSLFAEATGNVAMMDDSVDGRLPLGPPQPTNLREINRFGSFDLLNSYSLGIMFRPWWQLAGGSEPAVPSMHERLPSDISRRMLRITKTFNDKRATISYHVAPTRFTSLFVGVEGGLAPRSIFVRYTYPDGQQSLDEAHFTGSFIGLSARWFPATGSKISPHLGFTAAMPPQGHIMGGIDYNIGSSFSVGVEGRYAYCPRKRQEIFTDELDYRMNRVCNYDRGVGLTMGYRL